MSLTPESSPELTKRSWFGTLMGSERDETYTILVKGKPLASIKADLIHAFLSVSTRMGIFSPLTVCALPPSSDALGTNLNISFGD